MSVPPKSKSQSSITQHWCNLVTFSALALVQQQQINQLDHLHEPTAYKEDATSPHWIQAMNAEGDAL